MSDSVSNIHGRFYLTLINPSSYKTSLYIMLICTAIMSILINIDDPIQISYRLPLSLALAFILAKVDYMLLKDLPVAKMSKVYHVSAFAMIFWLITILLSILASLLFMSNKMLIVEGMMLVIGFRICIFRSVFGASFARASGVSIIMPLVMLLAFTDAQILLDAKQYIFGSLLLAIAIFWSIFADRMGKPNVKSTFKLLQAYLLAWTENDPRFMEGIMLARAKHASIKTLALFFNNKANTAIILPDIHPGPFNPVGGSNLPAEVNEYYHKQGVNAMVMHSISDHAMNIPSRKEVNAYLDSLDRFDVIDSSDTCSEPIIVSKGKARVTGIAFGNNILLLLSSSPYGMEDIPDDVKGKVEERFKDCNILFIDTHNAIGKHLANEDKEDMISACIEIINRLKHAKQYRFMLASASSKELNMEVDEDIGYGGLNVIAIKVNNKIYTLGWADANNMMLKLREHIVDYLARHGINMLEICTSDTHATSGRARNRQGYYTLGSKSDWNKLSNTFLQLSKLAISRLDYASYRLMVSKARIRLTGIEQFDDYSKALDRSMNLTKATLALTIVIYIIMLVMA